MRRMIGFDCDGDWLAGTLDGVDGEAGLLIVSGGNEIRSGAYAGQAALARHFAECGFPVFRYDRRGVGESEGTNGGFEASAQDIAAAVTAFRAEAPHLRKIVAFGNCDAATALALFHAGIAIDALILANPWTIETAIEPDMPTPPSAAAIRARYWARLKNPRSLLDLVTGKIDLRKLAGGLAKAASSEAPSSLAGRIADALAITNVPVHIVVAERDTTGLAFMAAWKDRKFNDARASSNVEIATFDTASHSFADTASKRWLIEQMAPRLSIIS